MRLQPTTRLCRLAVTGLAVTGLLGHGLAMLLVAVLAGLPAAAEQPYYGEICAAAGPGGANAPDRRSDDGVPGPAKGHLDACPVCTAFAHCGSGALPTPVVMPGVDAGRVAWHRDGEAAVPRGGRLAAHARAPPAAA
jgi:Protein of unknown function (DUF2946)